MAKKIIRNSQKRIDLNSQKNNCIASTSGLIYASNARGVWVPQKWWTENHISTEPGLYPLETKFPENISEISIQTEKLHEFNILVVLEEVGDIIGVPGQPSCVKPDGLDRLSQNPLAAWQRVLGEELLTWATRCQSTKLRKIWVLL